jgi:hypothetical protein
LEKELEAFENFGITPKKYTCIQTKNSPLDSDLTFKLTHITFKDGAS